MSHHTMAGRAVGSDSSVGPFRTQTYMFPVSVGPFHIHMYVHEYCKHAYVHMCICTSVLGSIYVRMYVSAQPFIC